VYSWLLTVCVHAPDAPRLRPVAAGRSVGGDGGQVSVRENSSVNLTCEVDAVPPASTSALNWYRNGRLVHSGQFYVKSAVQRRDAGLYECRTSNTMTPSHGGSQTGVGRATINLVVTCKRLSLQTCTHTRMMCVHLWIPHSKLGCKDFSAMISVTDLCGSSLSRPYWKNSSSRTAAWQRISRPRQRPLETRLWRPEILSRYHKTACMLFAMYTLHALNMWWSVACVDVAGAASIIGPHAVVVGDNVTLNCSVTDPGLLSTFSYTPLKFLFRHLYIKCSSKKLRRYPSVFLMNLANHILCYMELRMHAGKVWFWHV